MTEKTYLHAIGDGLRQEMRRDPRVYLIGEDIGGFGGPFKVTEGFQAEFGEWRVVDAPLSETAIVAACTGSSIVGMRPVAEMQFADFVSCAWDHLTNIAAKQHYRIGTPIPMVVRLPCGGGFSGGPFHSQMYDGYFAHCPGLKIALPATPEDAKGMIVAAIRDPNPVLFFEHKNLYRRIKGEVPDELYEIPLGKARVARAGSDVTIVTWSAMVHTAMDAAKELEKKDISVEVIDLRTLAPLDFAAITESVKRTGKVIVLHEDTRTAGFGAEIASRISEELFEFLDGPVRRIASADVPIPFAPNLERAVLPQIEDVVHGTEQLVAY